VALTAQVKIGGGKRIKDDCKRLILNYYQIMGGGKMHQQFLETYFDSILSKIDRACASDSSDIYEIFHMLYDDDLWNILLLKEYACYDNIKKLLPDWPSIDVQRAWVGNCGFELSKQSLSFYRKVKEYFQTFGTKPLNAARVLDFGCGWGRIIRYFARDVPAGALFGCDPDNQILNMCSELRVPGILRRSDYHPYSLPFEWKFDLVYAFSVFTHLSERVYMEALESIHSALAPGGLLVLTIRPRTFIDQRGIELRSAGEKEIRKIYECYGRGEYAFFPYHLAPVDGDITYGEACVPYAYIEKTAKKMFDLIGAGIYCADMAQVPVLLKKR
jgi:SAM-dependent methyltransferase